MTKQQICDKRVSLLAAHEKHSKILQSIEAEIEELDRELKKVQETEQLKENFKEDSAKVAIVTSTLLTSLKEQGLSHEDALTIVLHLIQPSIQNVSPNSVSNMSLEQYLEELNL